MQSVTLWQLAPGIDGGYTRVVRFLYRGTLYYYTGTRSMQSIGQFNKTIS